MLKKIFLILTFAAAGLMAGCDKQVKVRIETSKGNIVVELDTQKAPVTCKNFLQYVNKKYYDPTDRGYEKHITAYLEWVEKMKRETT